jgi:hypothetical protein
MRIAIVILSIINAIVAAANFVWYRRKGPDGTGRTLSWLLVASNLALVTGCVIWLVG